MQDILKAYGLLHQLPLVDTIQLTLLTADNTVIDPLSDNMTEAELKEQIQEANQLLQRKTQQTQSTTSVPNDPIHVVNATDPIQYLNYGVQGIIFLFVIQFGKPMLDHVFGLFFERVRATKDKELRLVDMQKEANDLAFAQKADDREFLQNFITNTIMADRDNQAKKSEQLMTKIDEQTRVMRNTNLIIREIAAIVNYQHKVSTGQELHSLPDLYDEEPDLEKATVTLTNPLVLPPNPPKT